jgi:hypothetical protein
MRLFFACLISLVSTFLASVLVLTMLLNVATTDKHIYLYDSKSAYLGKHVSDARRGHSKVARRPEEKGTRVLVDAGRSGVK